MSEGSKCHGRPFRQTRRSPLHAEEPRDGDGFGMERKGCLRWCFAPQSCTAWPSSWPNAMGFIYGPLGKGSALHCTPSSARWGPHDLQSLQSTPKKAHLRETRTLRCNNQMHEVGTHHSEVGTQRRQEHVEPQHPSRP